MGMFMTERMEGFKFTFRKMKENLPIVRKRVGQIRMVRLDRLIGLGFLEILGVIEKQPGVLPGCFGY
jgi:hypothetical protein